MPKRRNIEQERLAQYFTPPQVADFLASLLNIKPGGKGDRSGMRSSRSTARRKSTSKAEPRNRRGCIRYGYIA